MNPSLLPPEAASRGAHIWILERDPALTAILEQRLRAIGWRAQGFTDVLPLQAALLQSSPDLLVLGQTGPEQHPLEVLRELRRAGHRFRVLMLSGASDPRARVEGLEVGADDCLPRPFLVRELVLRIEHLLSPRRPRSARRLPQPLIYRLGALLFDPGNRTLHGPDGAAHELSQGDTLLLLALCRSGGAVLSRDELARQCGSSVTVQRSRSMDVRLSKLRRRLCQIGNGGRWISSVRGRGYRLAVPVQACRSAATLQRLPPMPSPWPATPAPERVTRASERVPPLSEPEATSQER